MKMSENVIFKKRKEGKMKFEIFEAFIVLVDPLTPHVKYTIVRGSRIDHDHENKKKYDL